VTDENIILDRHPFTNKSVTRDLAPGADPGVLLNLDETTDPGFVANLTAVEINETKDTDIATQLHVWRD
jgi:hypothetical protein